MCDVSQTLLKIAKVIPRLDSTFEPEVLAAIGIIRKLLAADGLKFVDCGLQLKQFVDDVLADELAAAEAERVAREAKERREREAREAREKAERERRAREEAERRVREEAERQRLAREERLLKEREAAALLARARQAQQPPSPTPTSRTSYGAQFSKRAWHEVRPRTASEYEERISALIRGRHYRNKTEKDFLESMYFNVSSGQFPLTSRQFIFLHDIDARSPLPTT